MQRRAVYFSGQVQGVGFRYTARSIAERFGLAGFVRNLSDGRVEMIVEGDSSKIDQLLDEISKQMNGYIEQIEQSTQASTGEFDGFEIRR